MHTLNHIYRTIWSEALGAWIAVSEITRSKGKRSGSTLLRVLRIGGLDVRTDDFHSHRIKPLVLALACCFAVNVHANPEGGTVVSGNASFNSSGNTLTVTNTPGTIINWQGFSISSGEATRFVQQSAASTVLNRVVTNNPSVILGSLQSNGQVYLVNANGIMFGAGATVDVAGLVATSLNLSDTDFLAGRQNYTSVPGAQNVSNSGNINAQQGGQVYLIAPGVENNGIITAPNGEILLAAGHSVELVNSNDPNLRVQITAPAGDATNVGQIIAESGNLGLFGTVVRNSGTVSADSATQVGGRIVFRSTQRTEAGGTISASGTGGGQIDILSDMQDGTVVVGGTLDASAPVSGDGGHIDTSAAHVQVQDTAHVTTLAANGTTGTWLIDPIDYYVTATDPLNGSSWITGTLLGGQLAFNNITITTQAGGTGNGDIFVNDAVSWSSGFSLLLNAHRDVHINAAMDGSGINPGHLSVHADMAATGTGTINFGAGGSVTLADLFSSNGLVNGTAQFFYNPSSYATPTDYSAHLTSATLTAWMLVNDATDLQAVNTNLSGSYALGNHIDASVTAGWNAGAGFVPLGSAATPFVGNFNGGGFSINNLYINRTGSDAGLFGVIGGAGRVYSVSLAGGSVTATGNNIGGLVGTNHGQIFNSNVSDMTVAGSGTSTNVGGFAGRNMGGLGGNGGDSPGPSTPGVSGAAGADATITSSYVNGGQVSGYANVGGFVGLNQGGNGGAGGFGTSSGTGGVGGVGGTAQLINVYASGGTVSGTTNVGGVVGLNGDGTTGAAGTGLLPGAGGAGGLASVTASIWDIDTTGQLAGFGLDTGVNNDTLAGIHSSTATIDAFSQATYAGWDFANTWWMIEGETRPFLRSEFNGNIGNSHQLQLMLLNVSGNYSLNNDINMSGTATVGGMWNTSGFVPIGNPLTPPYNFTGSFDGNNHVISNLYIDRPTTNYVGLFGSVFNSASVISDVTLLNITVNGSDSVGGLVGQLQRGQIINSNVDGAVSGASNVGGMVGRIIEGGSISGSSVTGSTVSSTGNNIGGLVGEIVAGTVSTSHVGTTTVTGGSNVGGLVGASLAQDAISDIAYSVNTAINNSYVSNGTVSGSGNNVGGLVGLNQGGNGAIGNTMMPTAGNATISGSYASSTTVSSTGSNVGGLVGLNQGGDGGNGGFGSPTLPGPDGGAGGNATITTSYVSGGSVSGAANVGALVGFNVDGAPGIDDVYGALGGPGGIASFEQFAAPGITWIDLLKLLEAGDLNANLNDGKRKRNALLADVDGQDIPPPAGLPTMVCR